MSLRFRGRPMLFSENLAATCPIRQKIRDFYRIEENEAVSHILPLAEVDLRAKTRAWERARKMVLQIRAESEGSGGIDALLNEYSLSSEEGVVLMCLAEALLRVPDKATQDELIRDKLAQGKWSAHLGASDSLFVNASSWGLLVTGSMVKYSDKNLHKHFGIIKRSLGRFGEPVIRKAMNIAMKIMGKQFVMGETIEEATVRAQSKEQRGYVYSYDMLGEGARNADDALRYFNSYKNAIHVIGKAAGNKGPRQSPGISIKLSAIFSRYEFTHRERVMTELVPKLKELCLLAKQYDISLTVDAEESERLDISLDVIEAVFSDRELGTWTGFGLAVQAYQKRSIYVIDWLRQLTENVGRKLMVRLVKGAYWDSEIKNAQKDGMSHFPVFTRKASTDVSYHACANKLLSYRDTIYPQFATHNAYTASVIIELAGEDKKGFEFQCLHGMGDTLYDQIVTMDYIQCRVYAPVGYHEDLLAYLVRRLLENGANSSFVNAIVDVDRPVEELLEDPVEKIKRTVSKYNKQIKLPIEMFGDERNNSHGFDVTDINELTPLKNSLVSWFELNQKLVQQNKDDDLVAVTNPANLSEVLGWSRVNTKADMEQMLERSQTAFESWSKVAVKERADILRKTADMLEQHREELYALCIKEAGKVLADSVDEVREAVDFCRYYAAQAEELSTDERLTPRGVVLCISPWNFPLAIFLGQVAAAVVTGNTVIAKPAEQTSLIALKAIELMELCGLPQFVVQPVIAAGRDVGDTLLPDERIAAVMFTGSTQTGTLISQILSNRGDEQVPLIAETGGQNCMIVDSTALPEQVVDDVIASGFQSAGQRCSALRVLFVQEDIADNMIRMIKGAMAELHVGDPQFLGTDVGPVIDTRALTALQNHADYMVDNGKLIYQCDMSTSAEKGHFFAPRLYEIDSIDVLKQEVFGPCVHVVRFKASEIESVIDKVNSTGFGLTMGIHTRIERRAEKIIKLSRAGNVYVNRNMIGAIVGVQPFGGRGLSGTGPKAGGPNYLPRLMKEDVPLELGKNLNNDQALMSDDIAATQASEFMTNACSVEKEWRLTPLNDRISFVRRLLAEISKLDSIDDFADDLNGTLSIAREQLIDIESKLKRPTVLPGPTGESNTLYLEPRGNVVVFADCQVTFHYWVLAIITALATGNTVITAVSDIFYDKAAAFRNKFLLTDAPEGVLQIAKLNHLQALLKEEQLAGVVMQSNCQRRKLVATWLSEREGAILPTITAEFNDNLITRLVTEKTVSVDTTASGGNTSLMTLEDE